MMVQKYVQAIRDKEGFIATTVVMSAVKSIVTSIDRTQLAEYGGLQRTWARYDIC